MIVILKENPDQAQLDSLLMWLKEQHVDVHPTIGAHHTILGLIGDTSKIDIDLISALDIVEDVRRVQEPYKSANRKFHPEDTVVKAGNTRIGGGSLTLIAGPCSVESEEQIIGIAKAVKASGATMLRGGAFKPRTSPYAFQGMQIEGIRLLLRAKEETGLPICTEIMDASQLPLFEDIFPSAESTRADGQTGAAEEGNVRHLSGSPDERGVRAGRREPECHTLREGNPHL